jgi:hypothetical protein
MYVNGLEVNEATGRAVLSAAALSGGEVGNGGFLYIPATDLRAAATLAVPDDATNGFATSGGRQVVATALPASADICVNSLTVFSDGVLAVSTTAPIAFWNQGWPMGAAGELCIDALA